jgi:hypothetical protein
MRLIDKSAYPIPATYSRIDINQMMMEKEEVFLPRHMPESRRISLRVYRLRVLQLSDNAEASMVASGGNNPLTATGAPHKPS